MPFNLAYLAGYLRQRVDCQIKILDTEALCLNYDGIKNFIAAEQPNVAAFTCLSPTINHVFKICQIIKEDLKFDCVTIAGGTHPTILPEETLANPHIDFAVIGEGEITLTELIKALQEKRTDFEGIKGLSFKKNRAVIINPPRELIPNLDIIPFPARDLFDIKLYRSAPTKKLTAGLSSPILTSRGCVFDCIHCVSKSIWRRQLRFRSAQNVIAEIEECVNKYNIKEFNILDDNFTLNKDRVFAVCDQIIAKKLNISWIAFSRASAITEELVKKMKAAGCKKISLGLESGSQKILDLMRKQTTVEQGRTAVNIIAKNGVLAHAGFMLGNIGETKDTIKETIAFAKSLPLDNASFFITCPVPGSDLYYYAKSKNFISNETPWEMFAPLTDAPPIPVQKNLSQNDLIYWQKRAFREFYLRPKYIIRKLKQAKSFDALKTIFDGLKILYRIITKKASDLNQLNLTPMQKDSPFLFSVAHRLTYHYVFKYLSLRPNDSLLDVGCGLGHFLKLAGKYTPNITGLDSDAAAIDFARKTTEAKLILGSADNLPFPDNSFDKIAMILVLEHLENDIKSLQEAKRVAKNNATFVLVVPALEGKRTQTKLHNLMHDSGTEKHVRQGYFLNQIKNLLAAEGLILEKQQFTFVYFTEIFIETTKYFYWRKNKKYDSQSDILEVTDKSALFKIYKLFFPLILFFAKIEDNLLSPLLKGHVLILKVKINKFRNLNFR